MFLLTPPSGAAIRSFLEQQSRSPLSYETAGITRNPPPGFNLDRERWVIGQGTSDFTAAVERLYSWRMFPSWTHVYAGDSVQPGLTVAVAIRHLGFWSLNGCRVVYEVNDPYRRGFAYGTLLDHGECGEESFVTEMNPSTGDVTYEIVAVSRPAHLMARLGYLYVRNLQARFRRDSCAAMRHPVLP